MREGRLNLHDTAHAFLPPEEVATVMVWLASDGPTRAADLFAGSAGERRKLRGRCFGSGSSTWWSLGRRNPERQTMPAARQAAIVSGA